MKKFFICLGLITFLGLCAVVVNNTNVTDSNNQCIAGRGCCSRHGGVCGCQNGRSKCCDGTLSPSCHCFRDDIKGIEI